MTAQKHFNLAINNMQSWENKDWNECVRAWEYKFCE